MSVCAPDDGREGPFPAGGPDQIHDYLDDIRYTDIHEKNRLPKFDVSTPPRTRILELLRPGEPGKDSLEDIVRPLPRRGLIRPYDEDTRRFLQRVLLNPIVPFPSALESRLRGDYDEKSENSDGISESPDSKKERSLAEELKEAEEEEKSGNLRRDLLREFRKRGGGVREAMERDRLGKLALSVEQDEENEETDLTEAARRLDALLAESRDLHEELAGIHEDMQAESARACRCAEAARALTAESRSVRYLDDVVSLLQGDVSEVARTRDWPFAFGRRQPERNYIVGILLRMISWKPGVGDLDLCRTRHLGVPIPTKPLREPSADLIVGSRICRLTGALQRQAGLGEKARLLLLRDCPALVNNPDRHSNKVVDSSQKC